MRVLVLGGRGYLGGKVVAGLRRIPGCTVATGGRGRAAEVRVDLTRGETLSALRGFDVVVDCGDTVASPPDGLVDHCLARGITLVETASEPLFVRRVLARHRGPGAPSAKGRVLLGAGIFTGLSNLLAGEAARRAAPCARLRLGIRWSALSAGGRGMVNLVPHLTAVPAESYRDGRPVVGPAAEAGPPLPFPSGRHATLHVAFSEPTMLAASTGVPEVATYAALVPSLLRPVFLWTPPWLLASAPMRACLKFQFTLLRRFLLSWRHTGVEMVAVAERANGAGEVVLGLTASDGMAAAGDAAAAMVRAFAGPAGPGPGLHLPDEVMRLEETIAAMGGLGCAGISLSARG